jgi:hypothetical protein
VFRPLAALLLIAGGIAAAADNPRDLQAGMVKVENDFFALYNQLNTDHQYDMVCRNETRTGTTFQTRVCQPRYLLTAKEDSATARMQTAVSAEQSVGTANTRGPDVGNPVAGGAQVTQLNKEEAFRKNMLDVLQKSPELRALGKERDELQARYDAAAREPGSR